MRLKQMYLQALRQQFRDAQLGHGVVLEPIEDGIGGTLIVHGRADRGLLTTLTTVGQSVGCRLCVTAVSLAHQRRRQPEARVFVGRMRLDQ